QGEQPGGGRGERSGGTRSLKKKKTSRTKQARPCSGARPRSHKDRQMSPPGRSDPDQPPVNSLSFRSAVRSLLFFSSRRRHTRFKCDWSSDVCSSDLSPRPNLLLAARSIPAALHVSED